MSRWWRWGVRAVAALALVAAGLLLTLHPSASFAWPPGTAGLTTNRCFSPYDRLSPKSDTAEVYILIPGFGNDRWRLRSGVKTRARFRLDPMPGTPSEGAVVDADEKVFHEGEVGSLAVVVLSSDAGQRAGRSPLSVAVPAESETSLARAAPSSRL